MKQLKIWNGRGYVLNSLKLPEGFRKVGQIRIYGCAHSRADLNRLINEFNGYERNLNTELRDYFSEGCWGTAMEGITPERGLWISDGSYRSDEKPVRIY